MPDHDSFQRSMLMKNAAPIPATSMIGREQETAGLVTLLLDGQCRLITLTGPGGVGKTRLVLQVTANTSIRGDYDVVFIPLASITDPDLVSPTIGRAFGLSNSDAEALPERLSIALAGQAFLLVLDNFEQLLPAAPLIANLLAACPSLKVLVTSRIVLRLSPEHEFPVAPLELPEPDSPVERIAQTAAVRLFLERSLLQNRALTPEESISVAGICRRVDGLPLAIELAAAKTRLLTPTELLTRMDHALPLLADGPRDAPARLQTMRDAISWSYDLLSVEEKMLFRAVSVFQGGFSLAAAEAIAPASLGATALQSLMSLVEHSLVHRIDIEDAPPRFSMLETVREFGLESLVANGEEVATRERHLAWFIGQLGPATHEQWFVPRGSQTFLLPNEQDNMRSALNWALDHGQAQRAAHIAWGLLPFWWRNGLTLEAVATLSRIQTHADALGPILLAGVMHRLGSFLLMLGDLSQGRAVTSAALELCRDITFPVGIRTCFHTLGLLENCVDSAVAIDYLTKALEISRSLEDDRFVAIDLGQRALARIQAGDLDGARNDLNVALPILHKLPQLQFSLALAHATLGWIAGREDDIEEAERLGRDALTLSEAFSLKESEMLALRVLGHVAFARGDYRSAAGSFQRAFRVVYQSAMYRLDGFCIADHAMLSQRLGDWRRAARLFGAAEANWNQLHYSDMSRAMISTWSNNHAPSQESMAQDQFASEYAAGQTFSHAEAYAEAMAVTVAPASTGARGSLLSPREIDVLGLIEAGHTNREIADVLFVSKRTIDGHVVSILAKLGVDSRRAAAAVARERGLTANTPSGQHSIHLLRS